MVFRLWAPAKDAETRATGQSAAQHPGVLALIEDAAASKRGVFQSTDSQLFVSGLNQPADALVISRQVQLGLQGFRARTGAHPVAVSIAIDAGASGASAAWNETGPGAKPADPPSSAPAARPPAPSHDLLTLLKLAKPAQILMTHDAWQRIANMKGLPLKPFPGRFGVYEYLWTAEEKLDLLQSEPQLTLAVLPAAPQTASTSMPAKDLATATIAAASISGTPEAAAPKTSTAEPKRDGFRLPRPAFLAGIALAAACVIALAGVGIGHVISSRGPKSNAPVSIQPPPQPLQPLTAAPNAPPNSTANPAGPAAPPTSSRKTPAASTAPAKTAKPRAGKPQTAGEETTAPPPAPSPQCAFAGDTARLASLAEQYRERGNYSNAERIFRQVLTCDPNNAAAREGLNRTLEGEQQGR